MVMYKNSTFNVPFYEKESGLYKVKIKVNKDLLPLAPLDDGIKEAAVQEFITSYLPEFYSYLFDAQYFQTNCDPNSNKPSCDISIIDVASEIKDELKNLVRVDTSYETSPPGPKIVVVLNLRYDFDSKREELEADSKMPLYEPNLDFFNEREGIGSSIAETTLTVGTIGTENKLLNNGLKTFDSQYKGFEGQIDLNVDFGYMSIAATKILNLLVTELTRQLRIQSPSYDFSEADTLTLLFGKKNGKIAISGINYLLIEKSIQSEPLKIGYFSIAKYNKLLQDPLTLALLRNYRNVLTSIQGANNSGTSYSFFDFLDDDTVKDSLNRPPGTVFDNFNPQPKKELDNILLKVANEYGLIDVNNVDSLEKSFKDYFDTDELQKLKQEVADNPDVYKRVAAAQKAKVLNTGVEVTKVIGRVLEDGPFGFMDQNPELKYLFRQLGIDELAKEAFICMTFGMNVELGRINKAVQNALVRSSSSIYYPPDKPKSSPINQPSIDLEMFKPFTISGDLWKEIEKTIIDTIQQTVLEVIKKVAELLRENCNLNTPRSSDYGANDLVDFIDNNPNPENSLLPTVGAGSQLDQLSSKNGLSNEQILQYLSDLSVILSSIDICILLLNREDAPDSLLDNILEFNQDYSLDVVRNNLNSTSDILGFFADLSAVIDATSLCNQIANELYEINQDNVCLNEGDLADENLQELLDLIENGLTVNPPNFDLECPDSEFVDPTISKSIPETFNVLAETVQLQFISSADSAKEILLEPVLQNQSPVLDSFVNAGIEPSGSAINLDFLTAIITALEGVGNTIDLDNCPVDLPSALGFDLNTLEDGGAAVLGILSDTLNDPEFTNGITGIANKLEQLNDPQAAANPVFTTYKFNQEFINRFRDYIQPDTFSYNATELSTTTQKFYSSRITVQGVEGANQDYEDLELLFKFDNPTDVPFYQEQSLIGSGPSPDAQSTLPVIGGDSGTIPFFEAQSDIDSGPNPDEEDIFQSITDIEDEEISDVAQDQAQSGLARDIEPITRTPNSLSLIYPARGETQNDSQLKIDFNLDRFYQNNAEDEILGGEKFATAAEWTTSEPQEQENVLENVNVFAQKFAQPFLDSLSEQTLDMDKEVYYSDFPRVYGQLVENAFEYILDNGIFDAATLQSLNFFSQTDNCPPDELGDFLDIQGIINQMIEEYKESACSGEDVPLSSKVRNVIKYGMYLLMVQIHIAETIIKNIFVMSAYNIDNILDRNSFVFTFIRSQILQSLLTYFDNIEPSAENRIRMDLTSYFNLKSQRSVVVNRGGILYLDGSVAIPAGTQFSVTDEDTFFGFDEILDFLITDRIDRSRQAINNALRKALPNTNQMSFNESILRTLPGITVGNDDPAAISSALSQLTPSSIEVLNIPETGLMMTMKLSGENAAVAAEEQYENLLTSERQDRNLDPLPVSASDFGNVIYPSQQNPLTQVQQRYVNETVIENTNTNRIFVHISSTSTEDEYWALNTARNLIQSDYPNAVLTEAIPGVAILLGGAVNPVIRYGWQVKGTLDETQQTDNDSGFSEPVSEEDITGRRYFKLWFKRGTNVYRLLDLGYRNEGFAPVSSDSQQTSGGIPVGGLPSIPS